MSRSVRDLRDLICVSRLQTRPSDDEAMLSDEEGRVSRAFAAALSFAEPQPCSSTDSRQSSAQSTRGRFNHKSPDSGFGTNGVSPETETYSAVHAPIPPSSQKPTSPRKRRKKKKKGLALAVGHELPRAAPLPPVRSVSQTSPQSSSSSDEVDPVSTSVSSARRGYHSPTNQDGQNFDDMLVYIDASLISEWLAQANAQVTELTTWCHRGDNYVEFAHFWLSQFPEMQRIDLIRMEREIVMDHLRLAFRVGRDQGRVSHQHIEAFCKAVFREYPRRLSRSMGAFLFLDHLDILTSERTDAYKLLLTDVTCNTRTQQHAQWTLAMRAFSLASIWHNVLAFFRTLHSGMSSGLPVPISSIAKQDPQPQRMEQAIRWVEVLQ